MTSPPAEQLRAASGNEDDDVSSDTSVEEVYEEGMLWTVEDVLAEVTAESGTRYFLVRWTGYDLHDATWEPEYHLEPATIKSWKETTEAIERGEKEKFNVADWWTCRIAHLGAKLDRAKRRDAKRQQRGQPVTGTAVELDGKLRETILDEAGFYGAEASELHLDDSDSDVDEAVLPPPKVVDLTAVPPSTRETSPLRTIAPSQPRKSTNLRVNGTTLAMKHRKGASPTGPSTTGASSSIEEPPEQTPQQTPSSRKDAPLSKSSSGAPGVELQPMRQTRPAVSNQNVLRAKRTTVTAGTQGAGANIFTSGKIAKKRPGLGDLMGDPSQKNKLFQKHRIARIAYKRSRDKEDLPPSTAFFKRFDISKGPANQRPKDAEGAKQTRAGRQERPPALVKRRTTDDGSKDDAPALAEKKRKSVTFCETLTMRSPSPILDSSSPRSEPVDIDESRDELFVPLRPPSPVKVKAEGSILNSPLQHLSVEDNFQFKQSLTIKRVINCGSGDAKQIEVSLDGIPNMPGEPWFTDFMKNREITLTHTCVAKNFAFQLDNIVGAKLGAGNIRSDTATEALENVASRLRLGSFGAVCFRDGYIIVVYPSRCNDWKAGVFTAGATSPSEVDLGYMLFIRGSDGSPPLDQVPPLKAPSSEEPVHDRALVWQRILGFDYRELLPKDLLKDEEPTKRRHAFFLVFPPSREAELDALCLYLRSCDQECLIYTNREEGSWEHMFKMTRLWTIIIHEATIWTLRRLRGIHKLMPASDSRATFWRATTAMTAHSSVPLGESKLWTPPGKIGLHRLLPSGKTILLTPSFLLTQPCQAAQFLMWYTEHLARSRHTRTHKIVVARDVCEYVREVADQRWAGLKGNSGPSVGTQTGEARGMSLDDCEAMEAAWMALRELFDASSGDMVKDTDLAPIVCAPDELRPSDEQSLVNWFGWWSLMNLDAYRCFIVLGTDEADMADGMATTVVTRLPTYHPDMVNDPEGSAYEISTELAPNYREAKTTCQRLPNDHPDSITSFLDGLNDRYMRNARYKTLAMLYKFPVGFSSEESRNTSPDYHRRLESFQHWFAFLRSYTKWLPIGEVKPIPSSGIKFVYGGFFYTPVDKSDSSHPDLQEAQNHRHPWLAFYRPARPHLLSKKKHDGMYELIIWDWTTPSKCPPSESTGGDNIMDDKLSMAQRQLIDLVAKNTGQKNPGSVLENVWLGGPKSATTSVHPMDITLGFLEEIMENTRLAIPATEAQLRKANYRRVVPQSQTSPSGPVSPIMAATDGAEEDVVHSDIFHPPRGNGTVQPSRCKNILFGQAQEAQRSRQVDKHGRFSFKFEPTTKWYEQQRREGRGFEHMLVGSWRAGFDVLLIGKEGKAGGSARSPGGQS